MFFFLLNIFHMGLMISLSMKANEKQECKDLTNAVFEKMCQEAKTQDEIYEIVRIIEVCLYDSKLSLRLLTKHFYNDYIGWGLPTPQVCNEVFTFWKKCNDPNVRLVDVGCGSGIFCKMFHHAGIPRENLIAVDVFRDDYYSTKTRNFWDVIHDDNYQVCKDDIFFIAWGTSDIKPILKSYMNYGGNKVVILGETDGMLNFSSFYLEDNKEWEMVGCFQVPSTVSRYSEHLTFNIRK